MLGTIAGSNPATGTATYYTQDQLGSTGRLLSAAASPNTQTLDRFEYDPYGEAWWSQNGTAPTAGYAGHASNDATTGLYVTPRLCRFQHKNYLRVKALQSEVHAVRRKATKQL